MLGVRKRESERSGGLFEKRFLVVFPLNRCIVWMGVLHFRKG